MMEAIRTSETSVKFYETTRRNIPEGCHLSVYVELQMSDLEVIKDAETNKQPHNMNFTCNILLCYI
jgi:hypothetical protein